MRSARSTALVTLAALTFVAAAVGCAGVGDSMSGPDAAVDSHVGADGAPSRDDARGSDSGAPTDAATPTDAPTHEGDDVVAIADASTPDTGVPPMVTSHCPQPATGAGDPELPRAVVDITMPSVSGRTVHVPAGGDLAAAIASAVPGDTITLDPGADYVGNFTLPVAASASASWIIVRTADLSPLPPEGGRISPSDAPRMAHIVTPDNTPALTIPIGAHHWRFVGIEFTARPGQNVNTMISLGSTANVDPSTLPHHIVIDRCYLRADDVGGKRAVQLNSGETAIIGSYIAGWYRFGQDTQAICGWNGPGPFAILNNYLEASAENVMFGGADAAIPNLIPTDIEICGNQFAKNLAWQGMTDGAGTPVTIKNLLELKVGRRVLIAGNLFEHTWNAAQEFAMNLKSVNQDGGEPWAVTEQVTVYANRFRSIGGGINMAGAPQGPAIEAHHIRIVDNVFTGLGDSFGGRGVLFQLLGADHVTIEHNTGLSVYATLMLEGTADSFVMRDNLVNAGEYGIKGTGAGIGTSSLMTWCPGFAFDHNALVGADARQYPSGNFFPADYSAAGFVDAAAGDVSLTASSTMRGAASDGRDVGADLTVVPSF